MIDLEHLRQNPALYSAAVHRKKIPLDIEQLLEVDQKLRTLRQELDLLRQKRNQLTEKIAQKTTMSETDIAALKEWSRQTGDQLAARQKAFDDINHTFERLAALLPGLPCPEVPDGSDDKDNVQLRLWGEKPDFDFAPLDHMQLAARHNMLDLDGARRIAGSRAYALKGSGALLELALLRFALDKVMSRGMTPVLPPLMVKEKAMFGTGYFPLGEDNAYEITKDKLYLTGTSEVGMLALYLDQTVNLEDLPLRFAGMTPCFRREAGSAGRDVKGLYRVHQFQKVEQVVICQNDPEQSLLEHNALLQNAEDILQELELPYRVVLVCAGDMGLGQVRKHDLETWMPSRGAYGETHSCSTFHDFQARRLNLKYKNRDGNKVYAHTLNNTAIASPRILIPFLENHQRQDGSIYIPPALRSYLGQGEFLLPNCQKSRP